MYRLRKQSRTVRVSAAAALVGGTLPGPCSRSGTVDCHPIYFVAVLRLIADGEPGETLWRAALTARVPLAD
jgi:hypothetical protein